MIPQIDHNKFNPENFKADVERKMELNRKRVIADALEAEGDYYAEYQQTDASRIVHKIIYSLLCVISVALMIASQAITSFITLNTLSTVALVLVCVSWFALGWFTCYQLRIGNQFNYYMYLAAVKKFRITGFVYASMATAALILSAVMSLASYNSNTGTEVLIINIQILAVVMAWGIVIIERKRKVNLLSDINREKEDWKG